MTDTIHIPVQSRMIDLPAGRFHYKIWGDEQAELPNLLLLHGLTSSAQSWLRVGPALADRYRVYALDLRGHGESIKPGRGAYSLRVTADDTLAFIERLGLDQPVVIGHSWGGAIAMVLASGAWSEELVPRLSALILEDPAHRFGRSNVEVRAAPYTKDIGRPAQEVRAETAAINPTWTEADIEGKIEGLQQVSREAIISIFEEAGQAGELLPLLARIVTPTLLLRADTDLGTTLNENAWEQAKSILSARSRAVQINGATHNIHRSAFEAFMQAVNAFLNEEKR